MLQSDEGWQTSDRRREELGRSGQSSIYRFVLSVFSTREQETAGGGDPSHHTHTQGRLSWELGASSLYTSQRVTISLLDMEFPGLKGCGFHLCSCKLET